MANEEGVKRSERWPYEYDRERGIFTPRDRRFLAGELDDELSDNQKRQKRYRLRRRVSHAIQDLAYLHLMETRDLTAVSDEMERAMTPEVDPSQESMDPDVAAHMERIITATENAIGVFWEVLYPQVFTHIIESELSERTAVDYYEKTGEYAMIEPTLNMEVQDTLSIEELEEVASTSSSGLMEYPGAFTVLEREDKNPHSLTGPSGSSGVSNVSYDDVNADSEEIEMLLDVITELDDGKKGAKKARVIETYMEKAEVSRESATEVYQAALLGGYCYEPSDTRIRAI